MSLLCHGGPNDYSVIQVTESLRTNGVAQTLRPICQWCGMVQLCYSNVHFSKGTTFSGKQPF